MSRPVISCRSVITEEILIPGRSQELLGPLLLPGPLAGQVAAVAGVLADQAELRGRHEAAADRAALEALRQPAGVRRVPLRAAGQVLDLPRIGQHHLETLGLQPVKRPLPVVPGRLHHHCGHLPAPQPVRQRQHLLPGGAEAAGLSHPPRRVPIRGHPDRHCHLGLADINAAYPVPVQRLIGHLFHATLPPPAPGLLACLPGGTARGAGGERKKLTRVLEATINGPWKPAPGVSLTGGLHRTTDKTTSRAVPPAILTPLRRRAQRYQA